MNSWNWQVYTGTTTATTLQVPLYVSPVAVSYPSAGHVPSYDPPSLAEDEMAWLRRRITEVTDLFPVAA